MHQHGRVTDQKNPLEHAVEVVVLAPIGFALEAKRLMPSFIERGRQQVNMAKVVGQFVVTQGQVEAGKRLSGAQRQAEAVLAEFGLRGTPVELIEDDAASNGAAAPASPAPTPAPTLRSGAAAASLSIADYDSLAASQVIPRLAGLSPEELAAVQAYEVAHRGRKTILGKITQLGGE